MQSKKGLAAFALGCCLPPLLVASVIPVLRGGHNDISINLAQSIERKVSMARGRGPKLVILAGSNAAFGFSAKYIEQQFGIPCLNLSIHAGLGREYILHYGALAAGAGDVFVLPLEYEMYAPETADQAKAFQLLLNDQPYLKQMPIGDRLDFLTRVSVRDWLLMVWAKIAAPWAVPGKPWQPSFNDWGDLTFHRPGTGEPGLVQRFLTKRSKHYALDQRAVEDLRDFRDALRAKGAALVLAYPNVLVTYLDVAGNQAFFDALRKSAADLEIPIVGTPEGATFPPELFYNTEYHTSTAGQPRNSARLAQDLIEAHLVDRLRSTARRANGGAKAVEPP